MYSFVTFELNKEKTCFSKPGTNLIGNDTVSNASLSTVILEKKIMPTPECFPQAKF